jgi:hypothetical protein
MTKLYVSGKGNGELQSNRGDNARDLLRDREGSPGWYAKQYPIIYELVPVSAEDIKPKTITKPPKRREGG